MSTYNICFHGGIRQLLCGYPVLSGAMIQCQRTCILVSVYGLFMIHTLLVSHVFAERHLITVINYSFHGFK